MNALKTISTIQLSAILGMVLKDIHHVIYRDFRKEIKNKTIATFLNHDCTVAEYELPCRESLMLFRDDLERFNTVSQFWFDRETDGLVPQAQSTAEHEKLLALHETRISDLEKKCVQGPGDSEVLGNGKKRVPRVGLLLMNVSEYCSNDDIAMSPIELVVLDKKCAELCEDMGVPVLHGSVGGINTRYPQLLIDDVLAGSMA